MKKVIYVPLDERACNYKFPASLAKLTDEIDLIVPPKSLMGFKKQPADYNKIWDWIFNEAPTCEYAILSVDTLVYGNIINSRIHHRTIDECKETLNNFRKLKQINPNIKIHAFNLAARVAAYNSSNEDPDYWETHGQQIWRYTYLLDKVQRNHASEEEVKEKQNLEQVIPKEYLKDFLDRRVVDRFTNLTCVELVKEGVFENLTVPKDDTAEYGYAALDQIAISEKVRENNLMDRVFVYPGADEVGCVLLARIFNLIKNYTPRIYVRYSSTLGATIVPKYEDRPINESLKSQITSLGGVYEDNTDHADCMIALNTPGKYMIESSEQLNKDLTFSSYINMHEFLSYIKYFAKAYKKPIGLAEVSVCNGCENEFMDYSLMKGVYEDICAVGGWNTTENTVGVVLAHLSIVSYYAQNAYKQFDKQKSDEFKLTCLVMDWLYQSNVLPKFIMEFRNKINPYQLKDDYDRTVEYFVQSIKDLIHCKFENGYLGKEILLEHLSFDWDGAFYIDLEVRLSK